MTLRHQGYRRPRPKALGNNPQLLLNTPPAPPRHTGDHLDPLKRTSHKPSLMTNPSPHHHVGISPRLPMNRTSTCSARRWRLQGARSFMRTDHGRIEVRRHAVSQDVGWLGADVRPLRTFDCPKRLLQLRPNGPAARALARVREGAWSRRVYVAYMQSDNALPRFYTRSGSRLGRSPTLQKTQATLLAAAPFMTL